MECSCKDITVYHEAFACGRLLFAPHRRGMDQRSMVGDLEPLFGRHDRWRRVYPHLSGHGVTPGPDRIASRVRDGSRVVLSARLTPQTAPAASPVASWGAASLHAATIGTRLVRSSRPSTNAILLMVARVRLLVPLRRRVT